MASFMLIIKGSWYERPDFGKKVTRLADRVDSNLGFCMPNRSAKTVEQAKIDTISRVLQNS
jgi:hypothetical protein